jgi:hypothetical protein
MAKEDNFACVLTKCFYCGGDHHLIMNTKLTKKAAEEVRQAHGKVVTMEPCANCKDFMEKGVILIEVKDGTDPQNPYRTGGFCVIEDEGIKETFPTEQCEAALKHRFCFVEQTVWRGLGLPTAEQEVQCPSS